MYYGYWYELTQSKNALKLSLMLSKQHGAKADLFLYKGKRHTDLFLQALFV
jgi:sulfur relay (sulfurtransferase) complex TusBCD TusD component (DsrE family)